VSRKRAFEAMKKREIGGSVIWGGTPNESNVVICASGLDNPSY
jgi:hypothetical protein